MQSTFSAISILKNKIAMKNFKINLWNVSTLILIVLSFVSTSVTFFKFIIKLNTPNHVPPETTDLIFVIFYGVVVPFGLTTLALLILKFQFDKLKTKFEDTNKELVTKFSEEIIRPLKIDLINAIKPTAHYNVIMNQAPKKKEVMENFIPKILDEFERKIAHMSMCHIYEYDPSKYHAFATSMFQLAKEKIIATSIVDPYGFWDHPMALSYLNNNKKIVEELNKEDTDKFVRYFFVTDENKKQSLPAIANNMVIGVKVYVINDTPAFDGDYRIDACLIDNYIAVISKVDKKKNIFGVDAFIDDEDRVPFIRDWTDFLESNKVEVLEYYKDYEVSTGNKISSENDIRKLATMKLKDGNK